MTACLFTYGVLQHSQLFFQLTKKQWRTERALLHGYQRLCFRRSGWAPFPVLGIAQGHTVEGTLVHDLDTATMDKLDLFEGVADGLYRREECEIKNTKGFSNKAFVYFGTDATLADCSGSWHAETFFAEYLSVYREDIIPRFLHRVEA